MILSVRHTFFTFVIITMFTGIVSSLILDFFICGVLNFFFPKNVGITRVRSMNKTEGLNDVVVLDFIGIVERYKLGYTAEKHNVITKDGYILEIHRITESPRWNKAKKGVVFLQHGLISSSDSWVLFGPGKDLAFLLADEGYDVWIGNIRGNSYGRSHVNMTVYDRKFWDFSLHEMGTQDLPVIIDYVLNNTGQKDMHYVSLSMGGAIMTILLTMKPEYNAKIKLFSSLAPSVYWKNATALIKKILYAIPRMTEYLSRYNVYDWGAQCSSLITFLNTFCHHRAITYPICIGIIFSIVGADPQQIDVTTLRNITSYFPAGTSMKIMHHFHQLMVADNFQSFDHGPVDNYARYKQKTPITYDFRKVTVPVALYYSSGDMLVTKASVLALKRRLPNVVFTEEIQHKAFNHLDFIWALDAKTLLYDRMIEIMKKFDAN